MAVKQQVGPFGLVSKQNGSYRYVNRQDMGPWAMVYNVEFFEEGDGWTVLAGLYTEGSPRRKPEQVKRAERFGTPMASASSFKQAKKWAYGYMRRFSGSPGPNGMQDLASQAGWNGY